MASNLTPCPLRGVDSFYVLSTALSRSKSIRPPSCKCLPRCASTILLVRKHCYLHYFFDEQLFKLQNLKTVTTASCALIVFLLGISFVCCCFSRDARMIPPFRVWSPSASFRCVLQKHRPHSSSGSLQASRPSLQIRLALQSAFCARRFPQWHWISWPKNTQHPKDAQ